MWLMLMESDMDEIERVEESMKDKWSWLIADHDGRWHVTATRQPRSLIAKATVIFGSRDKLSDALQHVIERVERVSSSSKRKRLAVEVMGWVLSIHPDEGVWETSPGDPVMAYDSWNPYERIDHAMMLAAKMPGLRLKRVGDLWECQTNWCGAAIRHLPHIIADGSGKHCGCIFYGDSEPQVAICEAILRALDQGATFYP